MLAVISSHALAGVEGQLVSVEVDIRRGLPGVDVVGLPDDAVRESKDRVRVAIRNSGYSFPADRILVSLSPAGLHKEGASYDLPIALGILVASGQIGPGGEMDVMVLGELNLSGRVRPVNGVLSAVGSGIAGGVGSFLVPVENLREARALGNGSVFGIKTLREAAAILSSLALGEKPVCGEEAGPTAKAETGRDGTRYGDIAEIRGHPHLKRSLEVAAAGRHHMVLFGPPGSGKTLAARALPSLLPSLTRDEALAVTRIHSIAGVLATGTDLVVDPPFRTPHHSASMEGIIGGGRLLRPGEVSLAHLGVLFLDEAPEFGMSLLQALREPAEEGAISIVRAGATVRFPASFQLILALNACPCGNLGRDSHACVCTQTEIYRYWRKIGGALLDRVDLRIPLSPVSAKEMASPSRREERQERRARVSRAVAVQRARYAGRSFSSNSRIPPGHMETYCALDAGGRAELNRTAREMAVSSRAYHAILRVARTIADLNGEERIVGEHLREAAEMRRYGDSDFFWTRA